MAGLKIAAWSSYRLRKAIEIEVRRDFAKELSSAKGFCQRMLLMIKIEREIRKRIGEVASPYSVWSSRKWGK